MNRSPASQSHSAVPLTIRSERDSDVDVIGDITIAAFRTLAVSDHNEQFIINALRAAKVLTISLVAEVGGRVVGHIAFSPVAISDGTEHWYGLGPVAVLPELHRRGIGSALINEGLSQLQALGAQGCALVGDPQYYQRFGFRNIPQLVYEGIPQKYFLVLPFAEKIPEGMVVFHEAFQAQS